MELCQTGLRQRVHFLQSRTEYLLKYAIEEIHWRHGWRAQRGKAGIR